jgi:hypothetical protein
MDAKTLEYRLQSAGYQHPTNNNIDRGSKYKTFSETDTHKAKDINDFEGKIVGRMYSLNVDIKDLDTCIICKKEIVSTCPCPYSCKTCKNGHITFVERDGKTKEGNPHKNR